MTCSKTEPPWEFLLSASRNSLQSYELSRLTHAANLRKEIAALIDQWIDETSAALLARWLIRQQECPLHFQEVASGGEMLPKDREPVSDNYFAHRAARSPANRGPA